MSRPGEGGQWLEVELTDPAKVNLYDLDKWVIRSCAPLLLAAVARRSHLHACATRPATKGRQCSLVEVMATGPQPPDYFVSHWWPLCVPSSALALNPLAAGGGQVGGGCRSVPGVPRAALRRPRPAG